AFTESEIEGRRQTPATVLFQAPRKVLRMIIPVVEEHVEDGPCVGLLDLALVAGQQAGCAQECGVVRRTGQPEVDMQQTGEAVHRHTQIAIAIEASHTKGREPGRQIEPAILGHIEPAIASKASVEMLDRTNLDRKSVV